MPQNEDKQWTNYFVIYGLNYFIWSFINRIDEMGCQEYGLNVVFKGSVRDHRAVVKF